MTFGRRLRDARRAKKLTQEQLGKGLGEPDKKTGVRKDASKAVISGWETDNHHPKTDQLVLICERVDCGADWLLFGKEDAGKLSPLAVMVAKEFDTLQERDQKAFLVVWQGYRLALGLAPNPKFTGALPLDPGWIHQDDVSPDDG